MLLLSKLFLVPGFLLLLSLAGKRWGPAVAGWLAGLPVVAGPILFFLSVTQGVAFASASAAAALSAVLASVAFSVAYAHAAQRMAWPLALVLALLAWGAAAFGLSLLPASVPLGLGVSLATLVVAPRLFPGVPMQPVRRTLSSVELACRMLAGAVLTVAVTQVSGAIGAGWSGLLSVFPVLGIVLAVFTHRSQGPAFAAILLRGMATGLYSFVGFCATLAVWLPRAGVAPAFATAVLAALLVQVTSMRWMHPSPHSQLANRRTP